MGDAPNNRNTTQHHENRNEKKMSDFYLDIEELIEALAENNIMALRKLFATWNLDINSPEDWAGIQDHIDNFTDNN